ncbi:hypothetical protein F5Y04DRAFT_279769 [Hypomontagnella monticulosa]|nr:hypothetical protein F5Y04DRAFT_279769 [Hypomontagnella monticulosa]
MSSDNSRSPTVEAQGRAVVVGYVVFVVLFSLLCWVLIMVDTYKSRKRDRQPDAERGFTAPTVKLGKIPENVTAATDVIGRTPYLPPASTSTYRTSYESSTVPGWSKYAQGYNSSIENIRYK